MMGVLIKRGNLYTDTYTWKTPLKDEEYIVVMLL